MNLKNAGGARVLRVIGMLAIGAGLVARSAVAADDAPAEAYRSPGEMTLEERTAMMQLVSDYNNCLYKEGLARVEQFPDIRQAADAAMAACESTSNKLRETIDGFRFEPGFGEQFVHHTQSRAIRSLIPELAIRKGGS